MAAGLVVGIWFMAETKKPIRGFRDLNIYNDSYQAMLIVAKRILPQLPNSEKYDLRDQLSRSTKAIPRLIAEGYGKKHQKLGFQKYLDDAMSETNETIVGIEQAKDLYEIETELCKELIMTYDRIARQTYRLAESWDSFTNRRRAPKP